MFASFGWYVIPVGHFSQKSLSGNPKIGSPLLPTAKPHPLLPQTCDPPPLYWLAIGKWCLSLVRAPLSYESIAFLAFIHLSLPADFSDFVEHSGACLTLVAWMSSWLFVLCISFLLWAEHCLGVGFLFFNLAHVSFHFWLVG